MLRAAALVVTMVVGVLGGPVQAQQPPAARQVAGDVAQTKAKAPKPVVKKVKPGTGPTAGGSIVKIKGKGFTKVKKVTFGGTRARVVKVKNPRKIIVVAPKHTAGTVPVRVKTKAGRSKLSRKARFTYVGATVPAPVVTALTPASGPTAGGTTVQITGTNLTAATAVSFGGTAATTFTVESDTSISATTPAHALGLVAVSVTTPAGTSMVPGLFTYLPLPPTPLVVLVTPALGSPAGGTAVTITGTGLSGATAVSFGGTPATSFTVNSDLSISATTPPHALGLVAVSVTTPGGTSTVPGLFLYLL